MILGIIRKMGPILLPTYRHRSCQPVSADLRSLPSTREQYAFTVFERLFKERGLPANIRSDNGVPFASAHALLISANSPSGGFAWALASNASSPGIPSKMAAMSACISP
jgi:hypothetical protein